MSTRNRLKLPKEHGAWAMLYVPFAVGALVAARFHLSLILLLAAVSFVFVSREPMLDWYRALSRGKPAAESRRMMILYLSLGALFSLALVIGYRMWWMLALGALIVLLLGTNLYQAGRREDRTVLAETTAIFGLTLTAPAAYCVAREAWDITGLLLWLMCILYFTSSVFYVKLRVHWLNRRRQSHRQPSWRRCAVYHTFLAAGLISLALSGNLSSFVLIAFAPVLARSFWQLVRPATQINLKRVGVLEILYSLVFLVFISLSFGRR